MVMASVTWVLLLWFKSRVFRPAPAGSLAADAHGRLPLQWPASDGFDGRRDSRVAPGPESGGRTSGGSGQRRVCTVPPQDGRQRFELEGFADAISHAEEPGGLLRVMPGREADNGNVPEFGEGLLAFAELDAVHDRHHQIEEDDGRLGVAEARQRIAAV